MKASKSHLLILLVAVLLTACDSGGGSGEQIKSGVKDGISGLVSDINKEVVTIFENHSRCRTSTPL